MDRGGGAGHQLLRQHQGGTGGADGIDGDGFGSCFDRISGQNGNDMLRGLGHPDALHGGTGPGRMLGGSGADALYGVRGHDQVATGFGSGEDLVDCGPGRDTVHPPQPRDGGCRDRRGARIVPR